MELGKLLDVNLTHGDIDIVHRIKIKSTENQSRPIIVRFTSYNAKSRLCKARLHLRNVFSQDLGPGKIYINENLTEWRAELREARWRHGYYTTLDSGALCCVLGQDTLLSQAVTLSICGGVTCDGLASRPGEV